MAKKKTKNKKPSRRQPTQKQIKLAQLISLNLMKQGSTKSMAQMMLEAGYSKSQSNSVTQITSSPTIKKAISPIVELMKQKREAALRAITDKKLARASAADSSLVVDRLTKNVQLLTGGETERSAIQITWGDSGSEENSNGNTDN